MPAEASIVPAAVSVGVTGSASSSPAVATHTSFFINQGTRGTSSGFMSTAGDAVLVWFSIYDRNSVISVTDSVHDSFSQIINTTAAYKSSGAYNHLAVWMAYNVAGGSSVTVTVTLQTGTSSAPNNAAIVVTDVTGVASMPPDRIGAPSSSTPYSSQQTKNYSSVVQANATDLVLSGVAARNYDDFTAAGGATRLAEQVSVLSGTSKAMTAAVFETAQGASPGNVWTTATDNRSTSWAAASLTLAGTLSQSGPPPTIQFEELGLPAGTSWSVQLDGTQDPAIAPAGVTFSVPVGTYSYIVPGVPGAVPTPSSGKVTYSGSVVSVEVQFTPALSMTLLETGLPAGQSWGITVGGKPYSAQAPSNISVPEPNGTHNFLVDSLAAYDSTPVSGSLAISGEPVVTTVVFAPLPTVYPVTIAESGLANGTNWSVSTGGETYFATAPYAIDFAATDGTTPYSVGIPQNYSLQFPTPLLVVSGGAVGLSVSFTLNPDEAILTFVESGLPPGSLWSVGFGPYNESTLAPAPLSYAVMNGQYEYQAFGPSGSLPLSAPLVVTGEANETVWVNFTAPAGPYNLTFVEAGLPHGLPWTVNIGPTWATNLSNSSVVIPEPNGSYTYQLGAVPGFVAAPAGGNVTISGVGLTLSVNFTTARTSSLGVEETGLPQGTSWSVTLGGILFSTSAPSGVGVEEPWGNLSLAVSNPPGFQAAPYGGTVHVGSTSATTTVVFSPMTTSPVTFSEWGLPYGTPWTVTFGGVAILATAPAVIEECVSDGTYPYQIGDISGYHQATLPYTGGTSIKVNGGPAVEPPLVFTSWTYSVRFTESGLVSGTTWAVVVDSTPYAGSGASLIVPLANGTSPYSVNSVPHYTASPTSSNVVVKGSAPTVPVTFTKVQVPMYTVTFTEKGLPSGTTWSVALNGTGANGSATTLNFSEANGAYAFSVGPVTGYVANPATGTLAVSGGPASKTIQFTAVQPIQHVVVIVLENAEVGQSLWNSAPYEAYLSQTYGSATNFFGYCHRSLPEYMAMTSGLSTACSGISTESVRNVADLLSGAGLGWNGYFESMPSACDTNDAGLYTTDHDPFVHYSDIVGNPNLCSKHVLNSASFNDSLAEGTLGNFSYYVPNLYDDGHTAQTACGGAKQRTCDAVEWSQANNWTKTFFPPILNHTGAYASAAAQGVVAHTAFLLLYDEGTTNLGYNVAGVPNSWCSANAGGALTACGGHTMFTVVSPYSKGRTYSADATDYNVESTVEWLFDLGSDGGHDGTAAFPAMTNLFSFAAN